MDIYMKYVYTFTWHMDIRYVYLMYVYIHTDISCMCMYMQTICIWSVSIYIRTEIHDVHMHKNMCVETLDTYTCAYRHRRSQIWGGILHRCLTRHTARLTTHQSQAAYSYICIHMYIYTYTCIYMYYMYKYIYAVYIYI